MSWQPPYVVVEREVIEIEPGGNAATQFVDVSDYVHLLNVADAQLTWTINHNLGRKVNVAIYTTGGVQIGGVTVVLTSDNQAVAQFSTPTAGYARVI